MSDRDRWLAQLALDAYHLPATAAAGNFHARVSEDAGGRVIAFRGSTADPRDWLADLHFDLAHDPQIGMVHRGFLAGARALLPFLPQDARATALTGHSLGGALALVIGALFVAQARPPVAIVTFGAPRAGLSEFCQLLAAVDVRQYRRGDDPVPLVPLLPFRHVREPLIAIGRAQVPAIECHRMAGYLADVSSSLAMEQAP